MSNGGASPLSTDAGAVLRLAGEVLAVSPSAGSTVRLRDRLREEPQLVSGLFDFAAAERLTSSLVHALLNRHLILGGGGVAQWLHPAGVAWRDHVARNRLMRQCTVDLVARANAVGVEPILLKGGQALWTGKPEWRHLRDLDLLVETEHDAQRLQDLLVSAGFAPYPGRGERPSRHHLTPLFRDDFPGWMEVHRRAGNPDAERVLGTSELLRAAMPDTRDGATARVLPAGLAALHGIAHHHVGHSAFARQTISLKGLHEFAAAVAEMSEPQRVGMAERADRSPRLAAMLDLWLAAAHDLFALEVAPPFRLTADASRRWASIKADYGKAAERTLTGYREEARMALDRQRIARARDAHASPIMLRLGVLASLLPTPFRPKR